MNRVIDTIYNTVVVSRLSLEVEETSSNRLSNKRSQTYLAKSAIKPNKRAIN